jgi:uncharacterized protein YjiS (DUF1127 family)
MKPFPINMSRNLRPAVGGRHAVARSGWAGLALLWAIPVRVGVAIRDQICRDQEIQELAAFSDRDLWDLGLSRSDLMAISNGTFHRD